MILASIVWVIATLALIFGADNIFDRLRKKLPRFALVTSGILLLLLVLGLAASPLYYEFPKPGYSVISFSSQGEITKYPWGKFCKELKLDTDYSPVSWTNMPTDEITVQASKVIEKTEDAPARLLTYRLKVRIADPEIFYNKNYRRNLESGYSTWSDYTEIAEVSRRIGDEMANVPLIAIKYETSDYQLLLSKFNNPGNPAQNREFGKVIQNWISPQIRSSDGLEAQFLDFRVSNLE